MLDIIDLKKIEKKFHLSYYQDGLWDIYLGLFFIVMGLLFYFDIVSFLVIIPAVFMVPLMYIKRSFALSRLGYVVFSRERQALEKNKFLLTVILGLLGLYFGVMAFLTISGGRAIYDFLDNLPVNPIAIFIAIVIATVTAVYGIRRFALYSISIIIVFFIGDLLGDEIIVPSLLTGIAIFTVGVVTLIRFIKEYPKVEGGIHHGLLD